MSVGHRLKERRRALGLSQKELAQRLGITPAAISNYESGQNAIREDILVKLFAALDMEPNYLYQDVYSGSSFPLSEDEKKLVLQYRSLAAAGQQTLQAVADALADSQASRQPADRHRA